MIGRSGVAPTSRRLCIALIFAHLWVFATQAPCFAVHLPERAACLALAATFISPHPNTTEISKQDFHGTVVEQKIKVWAPITYSPTQALPSTAPTHIRRIRELGEGSSGEAWEVELFFEEGRPPKSAVLKLVKPKSGWDEAEREGYADYRSAVQRSHLDYYVPIHGRLSFSIHNQVHDGYLLEKGGKSLDALAYEFDVVGSSSFPRRSATLRNGLLAHDLLAAVGEGARAGVMHHDIKIENLLIYGGDKNDIDELDSGRAHIAVIDTGGLRTLGIEMDYPWGSNGRIDPSTWKGNHRIHS